MIDMNAVIGSRAIIGERVHIGAGAVVSGVLKPPSSKPCIVENNVFIGANSVILEGVRIGKNAVVAAGAVVCNDVSNNALVAGVPARVIKNVDVGTYQKTKLVEELRGVSLSEYQERCGK